MKQIITQYKVKVTIEVPYGTAVNIVDFVREAIDEYAAATGCNPISIRVEEE